MDATILLRRVNIKILLHYVDLFYVEVDSIRLYMLQYYSINQCLPDVVPGLAEDGGCDDV